MGQYNPHQMADDTDDTPQNDFVPYSGRGSQRVNPLLVPPAEYQKQVLKQQIPQKFPQKQNAQITPTKPKIIMQSQISIQTGESLGPSFLQSSQADFLRKRKEEKLKKQQQQQ